MKNHCGENHWTQCAGTESFARARMVGVGREKQVADFSIRTPPRKIRVQLSGYKHTSLSFLVGTISEPPLMRIL